jgi:phage terminase large subunit-like protein
VAVKRKTATPSPASSADPATQYAKDVVAGKIVAGPFVRAACKRHINDLKVGAKRGLMWDIPAYQRVVSFFREVLTLGDGEHDGKPFILQPSQVFIVGNLFGWKTKDGTRRFRTGYIETAKGSGKSPLCAGIGLYMMVADGEAGAECYAAAVTRDQAKIMFRDAVRMVDSSPHLTSRIQKSGDREVFNLAHLASGSYFRPVSSEGRGLDGKRVHYAAIDEVHEHPTDIVVNKMRAGTKGRRQAMIIEATNSGYDRHSVCFAHHEYSRQVVEGLKDDDSWFAYVCALDPGDDPLKDKSCWVKANPTIGITITEKYIEEQVREAVGMPSKESLVRRLNFCEWVDAADPWIGQEMWRACEEDFDDHELDGMDCVGALDLSGARDLSSLVLAFELPEEVIALLSYFWTPEDTLIERARRDQVPYEQWVREGWLEATPGRAVDYGFIAARLGELSARFNILNVAFDPYRIKYFERDLIEQGVEMPLVPHAQGYYKSQESLLWMPRSVELIEAKVMARKLRVKRNPVLTWNSASAVLEADPKGNRIFTKRKSTGRIDGIVASTMAVGNIDRGEVVEKSFWET